MSEVLTAPVGTDPADLAAWQPIGHLTEPVHLTCLDDMEPLHLAATWEPRSVTMTFQLSPRTRRFLRRLCRDLSAEHRRIHCGYRRRQLARRRRNRN